MDLPIERLHEKLEGRLVGPFGDGLYYLTEHDHEVMRRHVLAWYDAHLPDGSVGYDVARRLLHECAAYFGLSATRNGRTVIPSDFAEWLFNVIDMRAHIGGANG